jgi:U4/U6.U5 tri-snRNP-associated protein 2
MCTFLLLLKPLLTTNMKGIIHRIFQGQVRIDTQTIKVHQLENSKKVFDNDRELKSMHVPFLFLSIDLPPPPLFQDEMERNIIPQVSILDLLSKYDGDTSQELGNVLKRFKVTQLPPYLILVVKRFVKNNFTSEKNPTIVHFPIKGLDMKDYAEGKALEGETRYDLVANVYHQGKGDDSKFKVQTFCSAHNQWYQLSDLIVEEVMPQMILLTESCIQIWKRKDQ